MIATIKSAPLRNVRLHPRPEGNLYKRKERFVELFQSHSVTLVTLSRNVSSLWTGEKDRRRCALIDKSLEADLTIAAASHQQVG